MTLKRWWNGGPAQGRAARGKWFGALCLSGLLLSACGSAPKDETAGWSAERLYSEAKEEMAAGNYEKSARLYERLEGRATGTLVSQQAQLERAYANYKMGEKAQALVTLERFIKLNPSSPALDYAYYLQGIVNFNDNLGILGSLSGQNLSERDQQASREAFSSFKQLVEQFPQSRYAPDAQLRMNYIINSLAEYEVHVARYYFRRGAYVAAANRAQQAVQEFQYSPAIEEALAIMVFSYERLGLTELRDAAQRVQQQNFPQTRFNSAARLGATDTEQRRWWQIW